MIAEGVRVLVVGDLMIDRYIRGEVDRVSPEAPVPVVRVHDTASSLGGAANVVANLAALGARAFVAGVVGGDPAGAWLRDGLEALGADPSGVVIDRDRPTTTKTRLVSRHQQIARFDEEEDELVAPAQERALIDSVRARAPESDVMVVADYDKGVMTPSVIDAVVGAGQALGVPVVIDPKLRHFFGYGGATLFKPNVRELGQALGEPVRSEDPAWMERVFRRIGCAHLLLTRGDRGMALFDHEGLAVLPATARAVFDVSGAGDTVAAVTGVVLGGGGSVRDAAVLANAAAGVAVGQSGVSPVAPEELLESFPDDSAGVSHP